jgi:uncharacterized protein YprB with RNaseH-like and TPR domain
MDILSLDIEASNLSADFGIILTFGSKVVGKGRPSVLNILDYRDVSGDLIRAEKRMLVDICKVMLSADVWLTHYGTWYDLVFINSRLLYHGMPVLPPSYPHIDTWKISRNRLKLRNNRLATIQQFLNLPSEKNAIQPEQWIRALGGHKSSMDYIVEHNRRDVLVLEEAYNRLRPLILDHPNKGLIDGRGGCTVCGSHNLQKRGWHVTRTRKYQRFQCQKCGAWSKSTSFVKAPTSAS